MQHCRDVAQAAYETAQPDDRPQHIKLANASRDDYKHQYMSRGAHHNDRKLQRSVCLIIGFETPNAWDVTRHRTRSDHTIYRHEGISI